MRCPSIVGRRSELAALRALVDECRAGGGGWASVAGEAGIGKTRLIGEVVAEARSSGCLVAVGRCSPADRATAHRPLVEALLGAVGGLGRPAGPEIAPYAAALSGLVPHWRSDASPRPESPAVLGESLLRVLHWRAGDAGSVLVLEDLHWADEGTVAVCAYLADHAASSGVAAIATFRSEEMGSGLGQELERHPVLQLPRLTPDEVADVAVRCLGAAPPASDLDALQARAGGLPLLVEDLLEGGPATDTRYADVVRRRLDRLPPPARRTVVAAALLGERFDWETLTAVAQEAPDEVASAIDGAVAAGLLLDDADGLRFRHALTHELVLSAAPGLAAGLTERVVGVLERSGRLDALARAAELCATAGRSDRAVDLLQRAAARAEEEGRPATALSLLDRAAALAGDGPARTAIDVARLQRLSGQRRVGDVISLGTHLLDRLATHPELRPTVHTALAGAYLGTGQLPEARRHLDLARTPGPEPLVLEARLALQGGAGDRRSVAEHFARQAVAVAGEAGRPAVACEAFEVAALCARSRSLDDAASLLERGLALAEEHGLAGWRLRLLNELGTVDMLRSADGSRLRRAIDTAMDMGAIDVAVSTRLNVASAVAMQGDLPATRSEARLAYEAASRLGLRPLAAAALVLEAISYGFRGDREGMERRLQEARRLSSDDADLDAFAWGVGRGLCALLREERAEALAAFERAASAEAPVGSLDTARAPLLLIRAVTGVVETRDHDAAVATATPGAAWSDLWLGYGEAALAGVRGDGGAASARFAAADRRARHHPLFRAVGLRLVSEAALRDGWGDPVSWLQDAEATFVAGGQDRIAAACRALLKRAGAPAARRRGADRQLPEDLLRAGVTAREAEVLALVADRLPNKEIAARLFLSPRTVEKHVASLLQKLGVEERAALVRIAAQR